jgi:hypothetical protein
VAVLFAGVAATPATADPIADKKAQAQSLADQIDTLGTKEAALSEQFDKSVLDAQSTTAKVQQAAQQVSAAERNATQARSFLTADAVNAYVNGGTLAQLASRSKNPLAAIESGVLRGEYVQSLAGTQADALDAYRNAATVARNAEAQLQAAQKQAQKSVAAVDSARNATIAAQRQLEGSLGQVKGQIATLVAQAESAKQAQGPRWRLRYPGSGCHMCGVPQDPRRSTARASSCGPGRRQACRFPTSAALSTAAPSTFRCRSSSRATWSFRVTPVLT